MWWSLYGRGALLGRVTACTTAQPKLRFLATASVQPAALEPRHSGESCPLTLRWGHAFALLPRCHGTVLRPLDSSPSQLGQGAVQVQVQVQYTHTHTHALIHAYNSVHAHTHTRLNYPARVSTCRPAAILAGCTHAWCGRRWRLPIHLCCRHKQCLQGGRPLGGGEEKTSRPGWTIPLARTT